MSKKPKKEEKSSNESNFEPLILEPRQAKTALLLLNCGEEDLQARCAESLFKYAMKSEENKKALIELNALKYLTPLLSDENFLIKRNCIMCIAVLSEVPEFRTELRGVPNIHKTLLALFEADEFPATYEYTLMCLTNMCQEYKSIFDLMKLQAITNIVDKLKSNDPDITKNAIELIYTLLQDFEVHPQVKAANALEPMIDLLHSEYPVIQTLALQAFTRASRNSLVRAELRDMEALDCFVNIMKKPEWSDLHTHALCVISNLLEDAECVQQMKHNGGLKALFNVLTDSTMQGEVGGDANLAARPSDGRPGEVNRKSPVPPKKGSAKGKKKATEEVAEATKAPATTQSDVKILACQAIAHVASVDDIRRILHGAEVERMLVILMSHDLESVRCASADAIAALVENTICQDAIAKAGGIECLIRMAKSERKDAKAGGINGLANITKSNGSIAKDVLSRGGICETLLSCLLMPEPAVEAICLNALTTVLNLSEESAGRAKLVHGGILKGIVHQLKSTSDEVKAYACTVVANLVVNEEAFKSFRQKDGLSALVKLLASPDVNVRRNAAWALAAVSNEACSARELLSLGAIQLLKDAQKLAGGGCPFYDIALSRLFDHNLVAKYAYKCYLDFTDCTPETFYDPGHLRSDNRLATLEELMTDSLQERRPVFLLNVVAPPFTTEAEEEVPKAMPETLPERATDAKGKRVARARKGEPAKHASVSGSSESSKEDTSSNCIALPVEFAAPLDEDLALWVDMCTNMARDLQSPRLVASQLAMFVADQLGGPIAQPDLMDFRYDLALSELRCNLHSNVIPMSKIKYGVHLHRALLYKYLADRLRLPVNLIRGDYNLSYNQIHLNDYDEEVKRDVCCLYLVDLIHEPGRLLLMESREAVHYATV